MEEPWSRDRRAGRLVAAALTVLCSASPLLPADEPQTNDDEDPKEIGLLERAGRQLAQIDITVTGPPDVVASLTREDFKIKVNLRRIRDFTLDRLCSPRPTRQASAETADNPELPRPQASYLFYHDQTHMTLAGRQRALELTKELIAALITDGNRGMLASNGRQLRILEPLTTDTETLITAVDRLERDREHWDFYAEGESGRVAELVETLNEPNDTASLDRAIGKARRYQVEETWRTGRSLRRLDLAMGYLSEAGPPKAAFYFADTMRSNAGEHYMSFFGTNLRHMKAGLISMSSDVSMARLPFDNVVNHAAAQGIRFYPVLSQGLAVTLDANVVSASGYNQTAANPSTSRIRFNDARGTLESLASETGGYAFVTGQRSGRILERIEQDFSCLYLASFDPVDLAEDSALRIVVEPARDDIKLQSRGRLVLQSAAARATARLTHAFLESGDEQIFSVRTGLVPTGFRNGGFVGLLQVSVPATSLPSATWDLGASVVAGNKVRLETSGRVSVPGPGVGVVYESEIRFKPGDYEVVSVAHEISTGLVASGRMRMSWPDPKKRSAFLGPIALLQHSPAAFLRGDASRSAGSLSRGPLEPVDADRPTAFVGLVCRGNRASGVLEVQRVLSGNSEIDFPQLSVDLNEDHCAQVRDLVPENSLGNGYYRYEIRVLRDGKVVDEGLRDFFVGSPQS
jgi:VWFA-related protein